MKRIIIIALMATLICLTLTGCTKKTYETENVTATYMSHRRSSYMTKCGKALVTHHRYYVTLKSEDGAETEFQSKELYDEMDENSTIGIYKIDTYEDGIYIKTTYSLTDK